MAGDHPEVDACQGRTHTWYLVPTLVYIVVMMVVGLLGNTVAVVVYYLRYKRGTTRTLILSLSVASLAANLVCCPEKIAELCLREAFDHSACGTFTALHASLIFFSALLLTVVAADRHRRVCCASRTQLTDEQARMVVGACGVLAAVLSSPFFALADGRMETYLAVPGNVSVLTCSMYESDRDLRYLHFVVIVAIFVVSTVVVVASYVRIARHIRRHQKGTRCLTMAPAAGLFDCSATFRLFSCVPRPLTTSLSRPTSARLSANALAQMERGETNCTASAGNAETARESDGNQTGIRRESDGNQTGRAVAPDVIVQESDVMTMSGTAAAEPRAGGSADADVQGEMRLSVVPEQGSTCSADLVRWHPWVAGARCLEALSSVLSPLTRRTQSGTAAAGATTGTEAQDPSPVRRWPAARRDHPAALSRTTLTLCMVTVIFLVSYLPRLVILTCHLARGHGHMEMTPAALNALYVFLYSSFISFTVNPIVYSVCSANFRRHCKQLFLDLRRKSQVTPQRDAATCSNASCDL